MELSPNSAAIEGANQNTYPAIKSSNDIAAAVDPTKSIVSPSAESPASPAMNSPSQKLNNRQLKTSRVSTLLRKAETGDAKPAPLTATHSMSMEMLNTRKLTTRNKTAFESPIQEASAPITTPKLSRTHAASARALDKSSLRSASNGDLKSMTTVMTDKLLRERAKDATDGDAGGYKITPTSASTPLETPTVLGALRKKHITQKLGALPGNSTFSTPLTESREDLSTKLFKEWYLELLQENDKKTHAVSKYIETNMTVFQLDHLFGTKNEEVDGIDRMMHAVSEFLRVKVSPAWSIATESPTGPKSQEMFVRMCDIVVGLISSKFRRQA